MANGLLQGCQQRGFARMPAQMPNFMKVTAVGLLAGLSFGVQFGLVSALNHQDAASHITTMQGIIPTAPSLPAAGI